MSEGSEREGGVAKPTPADIEAARVAFDYEHDVLRPLIAALETERDALKAENERLKRELHSAQSDACPNCGVSWSSTSDLERIDSLTSELATAQQKQREAEEALALVAMRDGNVMQALLWLNRCVKKLRELGVEAP